MKPYLDVLRDVRDNGTVKGNRTGVGTKYLFSKNFRCDLRDGFPLLTTKKINPLRVIGELFGFLRGATTVQEFQELGSNIWDAWGLEDDYYRIVQLPITEYAGKLAEHKGITKDEANEELAKIEQAFADWQAEMDAVIAKVSNNEIVGETEEQTMMLCSEATNEVMVKKPKTVVEYLKDQGVDIFVKDIIYPQGYLGPIYGQQWTGWETSKGEVINQLKRVAHQLEHHPLSRRIIWTGWNPEFVPADKYEMIPNTNRPVNNSSDNVQASIMDGKQTLPPCHLMTILDVDVDNEKQESILNMHVIMRSTDVPVGLPFNIASYAFLMEMIAKDFGFIAGVLSIDMTNCHIYEDQLELVNGQLERIPTELPKFKMPEGIRFDDPSTLTRENVDRMVEAIEGYTPQAFIKFPVAV